ncbi:MAG: peptidase M15 [Dehalococcoidia bacterium]|nr:peptidase M15 [Dehalococcoidia bacterium]
MKLSEHFTLEEATVSQTAARLGIDNQPDELMLGELRITAAFMEDVRRVLGNRPITVTSWYRCPALEQAIAPNSGSSGHHPKGGAVDFICPGFGSPYEVACALATSKVKFGQLIYEYRSWIHISRIPVEKPINRIITIDHMGVIPGIIKR